MTTTATKKTTAPPVPLPAGEWRRAILTADLPRSIKIVACQLAHYSLTDDAREVTSPNMLTLGEVCELPARVVVNAIGVLRRTGWIGRRDDTEGHTLVVFT